MAFRTNPAPYQRSKKSTLQIMLILTLALVVVWVFGIIYSFKLNGLVAASSAITEEVEVTNYGLKSIFMVLVSLGVTAICDVCTTLIRHNKNGKVSLGKDICNNLIHNYSYVTAIIFALTLPVYVSYYVVIVGAVFATVVVKNFFGGFGRNIFNPALMARIFVGLCFISSFDVPQALVLANAGIDGVTGATLTTAFNSTGSWLATSYASGITTVKGAIFADYTLGSMLTGQYVGALGETFTLVIFVLGIALAALKVINWRTPAFYLGTVALTSLAIALFCGFSNPFDYMMYHLCLGGVMFGAVFMITDPVTGPTSPFGKCLIGAIAGLMTVLIRVKGGYPEGVMYSIALCNFISPAIDYFTVGKSSSNLVKKICFTAGIVVISIGLNGVIAVKANGGKEVYDINGLDVAAYNSLSEKFELADGDQFKKVDYQVKTGTTSITDYSDVTFYTSVKMTELEGEHAGDKYDLAITPEVVNISIKGYTDGTNSYDSVYEIVNSNGDKVATLYTVTAKGTISTGYADQSPTAYMMIAINNDGSIYGISFLKPASTSNYASILNNVNGDYAGHTYNDIKALEFGYLSGATFSTNFVKVMVAAAYKEFNA